MRILRPICLLGLPFFALLTGAAEDDLQRVRFREVDTLFANPGQGWMSQQRSPTRVTRFPCSIAYIRFDWADVEPQEGQYNWKFIDDVISAWKPRGAAVAMRVMTANAHSGGYYSSPKWLFDAGCKGFEYNAGGGDPTSGGRAIPRIEPDYADPIYLAKHGAFIAALGKRYDGTPGVEFLDIGSYGIWGEWHTTHPAPVAVRKQIVDMYLQAFPKTPLVFMSDDVDVMGYALAHGAGIRRDGVGSPWHEQNWIGSPRYAGVPGMADTWKKAPAVFDPSSTVTAENQGVLRGKPSLGSENVVPNSSRKVRFCLRNTQSWRNYVEEKKATCVFPSQTHWLLCLPASRGEFSRRRPGASAGLEHCRASGGAPGQRAVGGAAALRAALLPETHGH